MATKKSTKQTRDTDAATENLDLVRQDLCIIRRLVQEAFISGIQRQADALSAVEALATRAGRQVDKCVTASGGVAWGEWDDYPAKKAEVAHD